MSATTSDRNTPVKQRDRGISVPVKAATKIPAGTLVAVGADGLAVPAADTAALKVVGVADELADNTSGASGDIRVRCGHGVYLFAKNADIAQADVGKLVYVEDNQTVQEGTGTNSIKAGVLVEIDIETGNAWVLVDRGVGV